MLLHGDISNTIINSFFAVNKSFPYGLSIDFYKNALHLEFEHNKLLVEKEKSIDILHRNKKVGVYYADFLINEKVLVLVVNKEEIDRSIENFAKLLMRESLYEVCIALNIFGDTSHKRFLFTNNYKKHQSEH